MNKNKDTKKENTVKRVKEAQFKKYNEEQAIQDKYDELTKSIVHEGKELRAHYIKIRTYEELLLMKKEQLDKGIKETYNGMLKTEGLIRIEAIDLQEAIIERVMKLNKIKDKLLSYEDSENKKLLNEQDLKDIQFGDFDYTEFNKKRNLDNEKAKTTKK